MRSAIVFLVLLLATSGMTAFPAQFPRIVKERASQIMKQVADIQVSEEDEIRLGEEISARVRQRYGVEQDPKVHEYVALTGNLIVQASARKNLPFRFIVLDTDGVNAFAAPGGFVHITRGALALIRDEAQLAGVLAHEIAHITERHTMRAIQKGKMIQIGASEAPAASNPKVFQQLVDVGTRMVMAGFDTAEELEADAGVVPLTLQVGYSPLGLGEFLRALKERNSSSEIKQGLFASHPEMEGRLAKLDAVAKAHKAAGGAVLQQRYAQAVRYKPVAPAEIALVAEGTRGVAGGGSGGQASDKDKKEEKEGGEKKRSRFSLSRLSNPLGGGEETKQSAAVTGSGATRGVDREREAKGGANTAEVKVTITAEMIEKFRKEGNLKAAG